MIQEFNGKTPDISKALFVADNAVLTGDVILEEGVTVWYGAVLRGDSGTIRIGKNSNIQDNCTIHCDRGGEVRVGENVVVGHNVILHGCEVQDGCMIGMGSIVMNDACIRECSLVGAGSLVTERRSFPAGSLILGSPARAVRPVTQAQLQMMQEGAQEYLQLGKIYSEAKQSGSSGII